MGGVRPDWTGESSQGSQRTGQIWSVDKVMVLQMANVQWTDDLISISCAVSSLAVSL